MEYFERSLSTLKPSHVYISFGGYDDDDDTRKFIRNLSAALKAKGLRIFGREKNRETGVPSFPYDQLGEAIDESWIWIVVFAKNYASSRWCLWELAKFAECRHTFPCMCQCNRRIYGGFLTGELETRMKAEGEKVKRWMKALKKGPYLSSDSSWSVGDRIIPVYFNVDPKSFAQHIQQACPPQDLLRQEAVKQVVTLSGWHVRNYSSGSQVIPKVVKQVKSKMDKLFYDFFRFVGIQSQVEEVEKLLDLSTDDEVRVVGICGMSGLGKSSIAQVLYLKIFHYFDAFCFLPNVSELLEQGDLSLHELLHRHLETDNVEVMDFLNEEFLACKRLRKHKFLIVLDGVNHVQHLEELNLVEKSNCFGTGSRIIITTRDEQVLQEYEVDTVYRPKLLSKDEAFKLFCSKAFQRGYPITDFKEMIYRVLEYAGGLPLAIEKLGSYLFGKGIAEWKSFLDREEIILPFEIIMVLRKTFDELDHTSQEMFLDIACFFVGKDIDFVKEVLQDCIGFCADKVIKLLIRKSIITIANQRIQMHCMLQAMGRKIIREQCPNQPDKLSRLYLFNDIKHIMEKERDKVIENVEAICLDLEEQQRATLKVDALSNMINLRLLIFRNVKFSGTLHNLSRKLGYVSWHQYPFTSLPLRFQSSTLIQLIMLESNMTEVWKGKMRLPNLRKLNLSGSKTLTKTPYFGGVPKLERLELEGCTGLLRLDPSIAELSNLKFLNLRGCINLVSIPNSLFCLNSLEVLNLAGCSKLAYCLEFSPMKNLIHMKLLSTWHNPFVEKLLYFLLLVLPKNYRGFAACYLIYLMCFCEVNYV